MSCAASRTPTLPTRQRWRLTRPAHHTHIAHFAAQQKLHCVALAVPSITDIALVEIRTQLTGLHTMLQGVGGAGVPAGRVGCGCGCGSSRLRKKFCATEPLRANTQRRPLNVVRRRILARNGLSRRICCCRCAVLPHRSRRLEAATHSACVTPTQSCRIP